MRTKGWTAVLVLALVPMLASCGDPEPGTARDTPVPDTAAVGGSRVGADSAAGTSPVPGAADATPDPATPDPATPDPATPDPAAREDSLRSALRALLAGPTPEQRATGDHSWFSDTTADALREVEVDDGRVVVDFVGDLHERIPNASSSAGSGILLADLDSVVFGFPWVEAVEYRMGGSCEAFWEWLQRSCETVRR